MSKYKFYTTKSNPQTRVWAAIVKFGTERQMNTDANFCVFVTESGLGINGDYGSNPSKEEMAETLELFREAVAEWDKRFGNAAS